MAIVFSQDISTTLTLMAFNNNVIRFSTNTTGKVVLNASIFIGSTEVIIYPNQSGNFYFNFKEYIAQLTTQTNFVDTVNPVLDSADDTTFVYIGNGMFQDTVTIQINFTDETTESVTRTLTFIAGVEQLDTYKRNQLQTGNDVILSPLMPSTSNHYYVKYWEGYPFDVTFFSKSIGLGLITLENMTNIIDYSFQKVGNVNRIFFCDGNTDETISDLLPIGLGVNEIKWSDKYLIVDKQDVCNGLYLKWVNNYGGYNYYNFGNIYRRAISTKSLGEIVTDYENLSNTFSQTSEIGKSGTQRVSVQTDILTDNELSLLTPLLTSPKVYLFVGEPFSRASVTDWIEVKIVPQSYTVRNYKEQPTQLSLEIELPDLYTQNI